MEVKAEIKGLDQMMKRLLQIYEGIKPYAMNVVAEEAERAVNTMKVLVPVRTGFLHDSIGITEFDAEKISIKIEAKAPYASYVEHGTVKMHARPFFYPALYEHWERVKERLRHWIREVSQR